MCDRFLFTRLQEHFKMQHYLSTEELKMDVQRFLTQLPKSLLLRPEGGGGSRGKMPYFDF